MSSEIKKDFDPETLLRDHGKDISGLAEKLGKCYSSERYEDFQGAVEKIAWRYFRSNVAWGAFIWLVTIIVSILVQKFFNIL